MYTSEADRQFYLGVAGVRLWYAREALPGAAPSPDYDFGEEPEDSPPVLSEVVLPRPRTRPAVPSVSPVSPRAPGGKLDLRSLMEQSEAPAPVAAADAAESPVATKVSVEVAPEPVADEPGEESGVALEPLPELNIHIWSGGSFTLIAGVSREASLRLQETLAVNILRSLAELSPRSIGQVCWPLFNNYRVPANSLEDLRSVISQVLSGAPAPKLVVIGVDSGAEDSGVIPWLDRKPEVVFPHTLAELAADARLKRSLWRLLKPLVDA